MQTGRESRNGWWRDTRVRAEYLAGASSLQQQGVVCESREVAGRLSDLWPKYPLDPRTLQGRRQDNSMLEQAEACIVPVAGPVGLQ